MLLALKLAKIGHKTKHNFCEILALNSYLDYPPPLPPPTNISFFGDSFSFWGNFEKIAQIQGKMQNLKKNPNPNFFN
jgi:hypothetical protein